MIQTAHSNPASPDALVARMASLADPTRLRLLRLLERHELGVVDLCEVLQMPQSTVSRHLKILADQGWTLSRRQGTTNLYELAGDDLDPAARELWDLTRDQTDQWATIRQDEVRLQRRLREHRRDAQAFFAGAAGEWDKLRVQLYGRSFMWAALAALMPADWVVADLGCGTGHTSAALGPIARKVIAVDNSPAMLKAARSRLKDLDNVDLRRGDLEALPIDDATCDAALLLLVLTYVEQLPGVLREAARVLKPGGVLVIVDLLEHDREDFRRQMDQVHKGFDPHALATMLRDAGLKDAHAHALVPEPEAKGPALLLARGVK